MRYYARHADMYVTLPHIFNNSKNKLNTRLENLAGA